MNGAPVDAEGGPAAAPAQHSTPGAAAPTGENNRESLPEGLNIKFTPESQQGLHELEAMLHGPTGLSQLQSQEPLMQSQDCSLQQEMLQAEQNSTERGQSRAQQAAAALRGEAAAGNPAAGVLDGAEGGLGAEEAAATIAAIHAAAAAAAAGGSAQDADQLLKLAQAAQQLQQQQGIDPTTYAALQQQGLDWSGFAAGMPMAMGAQAGMMNPGYYWPAQAFPQQQYQQKHTSLSKLEHANSNAKRRGPMDEMRQLQRILTKLLPGSIIYMPNQDGGGNKVQADDIKVYLAATLGQAPKPDWGLKNGWGQYLADLFNWATGREGDDRISREQAMSCARRPQGRSWEVVFDKLMELGVYSWNWELPLERQQVLNCRKTPPPELTRQQEALAAATAAAAAAAAVTAGATPDAIPSLPVVARMASLLGKRQHQPLPPMPALSAPAAVFHADTNGALEAGGSMGTTSAGPSGAAPVDSEVEAGADERAPKQQRRSSAAPAAAAAAGSGGTSPVDAPSTSGQAAGQPLAAVSDADLVVPAPEVLAAASVQQLMSYIDNSLSGALQALQARVMSGNAICPSMDYVMSMKNFKLDPLYASCVALIVQAANNQAAMEQQVAQQAALQQAAMKVKAEPGASSQPAGAPAPGTAPVASTAGTAASTGLAASSAGAGAADEDTTAAAGTNDAQGERDSDAALAAAAAAAGAAAAAAAMALSHGMAGAAPKAAGVPPAAKGRKSGKGRAAREPQPSLQHMVMQQSAVQAAALEAAAMAAAARQRQQKAGAGGGAPSAAAITADRLARLQAGLAGAEGQLDSEDAAQAAAAALTALAGSQEQQLPGGMHMNYQHDAHKGARPGNSRIANGSSGRGAAAPASPMEAN